MKTILYSFIVLFTFSFLVASEPAAKKRATAGYDLTSSYSCFKCGTVFHNARSRNEHYEKCTQTYPTIKKNSCRSNPQK